MNNAGKVIKINQFEGKDSLIKNDFAVIEYETLRKIEDDEVLICVKASPISNLDVLKIMGLTPIKHIFTPGSEGSGVIIDSANKELIGKKVIFCFTTCGCMREYIILKINEITILNEYIDISFEEASILNVNPLTAYGLINLVKKCGAKCFIQDSANSSIGKIVYRLSKYYGLDVINIVRSDERVKEMKEMGCEHVLNMTEIDFERKLNQLSNELGATIAIDSLSGDIVGTLLKALPFGGILINYGTQTRLPMTGIDATDLRWGSKEIKTFVLTIWYKNLKQNEKEEIMNFIIENFKTMFKQDIGIKDSMWTFYESYLKFRTKPNHRCVLIN
jgi:NADPH:quinone reductase-like Zn-dependent oxidoreductase